MLTAIHAHTIKQDYFHTAIPCSQFSLFSFAPDLHELGVQSSSGDLVLLGHQFAGAGPGVLLSLPLPGARRGRWIT